MKLVFSKDSILIFLLGLACLIAGAFIAAPFVLTGTISPLHLFLGIGTFAFGAFIIPKSFSKDAQRFKREHIKSRGDEILLYIAIFMIFGVVVLVLSTF